MGSSAEGTVDEGGSPGEGVEDGGVGVADEGVGVADEGVGVADEEGAQGECEGGGEAELVEARKAALHTRKAAALREGEARKAQAVRGEVWAVVRHRAGAKQRRDRAIEHEAPLALPQGGPGQP